MPRPAMHVGSLLFGHALGVACAMTVSALACAGVPGGFAQSTPESIRWAASPSIPQGGQSALIYGDPRQAKPYITRVKLPYGYLIPPHSHPDERVYTVISGTFYVGFGDTFDAAALKSFPAGSTFVLPAHASHFHQMRSGEAIVQISGVGPSGIDYIDHADDPRR
jgi:quercetin dioxygenase-like cupin family protein